MAEDGEEISPEAKLNIAQFFICSSPTGEVADVVADVEKLVDDKATLNDKAITKIMQQYNTDQLTIAADPDGKQLFVSAAGQVAQDSYVDPTTGRVLKFDHRKQKFTEVTDQKQSLDDGVNKYRAAVQKALDSYIDSTYNKATNTAKVVGLVYGNDGGKLTVAISARNVHLGNFWTGAWRSVYTLQVDSKGAQEFKGSTKIQVHYFEDGNVQLHGTLDKALTVNVGSEDATAAEVVKAIGKIENDYQNNLEEMYVKMHSTTFKSMRRFYPVTRTPMNWNTSAHSLASEVGK